MTKEKLEAMYLMMLAYANHAYVNQPKRDDDIYKLLCKINKIAVNIKPRKRIDQQLTKQLFYKMADLDQKEYEQTNRLYAPEINMIVLIYYLVAEHRFADLIVKCPLSYIRAIHNEVEIKHREITFQTWKLLDRMENV